MQDCLLQGRPKPPVKQRASADNDPGLNDVERALKQIWPNRLASAVHHSAQRRNASQSLTAILQCCHHTAMKGPGSDGAIDTSPTDVDRCELKSSGSRVGAWAKGFEVKQPDDHHYPLMTPMALRPRYRKQHRHLMIQRGQGLQVPHSS